MGLYIRKKELPAYVMITLLYLSMSNFFYFIDSNFMNIKGIGKIYDLVFVMAIFFAIRYIRAIPRATIVLNSYLNIYLIFLIYVLFEALLITINGEEIFQTIRTIREFFLIFVAIYFICEKYNGEKILKYYVFLETIASIIYIIQFVMQTPFLKAHYIYEILGGSQLLRSYASMPLCSIFTFSYIYIKILKKDSIFRTRKRTLISFLLITLAIILHLTRTTWIAIIVAVFTCLLFYSRKLFSIKKVLGILIVSIFIFKVVPNVLPSFVDRLTLGIEQLQSNNGTAGFRSDLLETRYQYLMANDKVLLGLGPLNSDYNINFGTATMSGMYTADSSWSNILIRYGMVGSVLLIISLITLGIKLIKKSTSESVALGLTVLMSLIMGYSGSDALGLDAFLKMGMILGIVIHVDKSEIIK